MLIEPGLSTVFDWSKTNRHVTSRLTDPNNYVEFVYLLPQIESKIDVLIANPLIVLTSVSCQ